MIKQISIKTKIGWITSYESKGKIFKYWNKVKVSGHVQEVLEISKNCP